jgi:hypothetical protein
MKITFNFDKDCRAFNLEPEDELEFAVLSEMEAQASKGSTIKISKITPARPPDSKHQDFIKCFRIEMRVNGHQAKATRSVYDPKDDPPTLR